MGDELRSTSKILDRTQHYELRRSSAAPLYDTPNHLTNLWLCVPPNLFLSSFYLRRHPRSGVWLLSTKHTPVLNTLIAISCYSFRGLACEHLSFSATRSITIKLISFHSSSSLH
jgi:hypothetical protein